MTYQNFLDEIDRAYRVLGEIADCQNHADIEAWFNQGYISECQRQSLHKYNRKVYKSLGQS